jgi:hypothetical protein
MVVDYSSTGPLTAQYLRHYACLIGVGSTVKTNLAKKLKRR